MAGMLAGQSDMEITPSIVAPVIRVIGVADETRTIAFYRDLLGFKVIDQPGPIEAVYGPARVQFERREDGPQSILFFQTDDVHAMHAAIRARGGSPSEGEKGKWI